MPGDIHHGYLRYRVSRNGLAFEHYMVARVAWGPRAPWPKGVTIHHQDHCRQHNCRPNLVIMSIELNNLMKSCWRQDAQTNTR
jgi:hypothetical protein